MKEVNVTFKSDGKIQSIDADSIFLEEENLSVKITASFPSDLTISGVRAYIRTNSGVQDCVTPVLTDGKYTLTLTGDKLEKGVLKIGYEVTSGSASIRFAPVVLNVDGFISDDYIISKKLYTVSVSVADTQTVDSTQNASVENVGSSKEVKLKFKIPKGDKGDKGDMPAVTDSLDSDSTTAALSANQGKVLNEILNKKLTVYSAAESELDSLVIPSGESEGRLYQVTGIGSFSPSYFVFVYVKETCGQVTNILGKTYTTTFNLCAQMRIKYDVQTSEGEIIRSHNAISTRYQTSKTAWSDWVDIADSTDLEGKVDKADGKGLSSNDYTTAEKSKVANLPDDTNTELSKKADDTSLSAHKGASVLDHPDESVTTAKLGTSAVETDKLKDGAVTKTKIADGAVSESKFDSDLSAAFTGKENSRNKGQPNGYAPLDANGKLPDSYLYGVTVKQYGIRWKGTSSTVCERLGDAVGLTAKAHKGSTESVENDFDNIYPWSDIKTCNIDADGNVLAYLGEPSFARDGTNGDVMVEIPKFYYKRVKTGIVEEIWICGTKLPGYELHPLFIDNGKEVSKVFHSVYNASSFTDETDNKVKLQSITGVQPRVRTTRANFRTYARNKGAIWGIEDISCVNALQLLYLVEYANTNSQSALGSGADNLSYAANHKALEETTNGNTITIASTYKNTYKLGQRIEIGTSRGVNDKTTTPRTITAIATDEEAGQTTITFDGDPITIAVGNMLWNVAPLNGSCDALNGKSGWLAGENNYTDHLADVNYRGIEGFHAKLFRFIDGVNIKDRVVYYANSIADYADGVYDGKYRAVGYSNAEANGYVSAFGYDEKAPWVMFPSAAVGGSSTFVPDYYYQNTGERLLSLGGYWYDGTYAGVFCFICNLPSSYSYSYCGSHLLVKKP